MTVYPSNDEPTTASGTATANEHFRHNLMSIITAATVMALAAFCIASGRERYSRIDDADAAVIVGGVYSPSSPLRWSGSEGTATTIAESVGSGDANNLDDAAVLLMSTFDHLAPMADAVVDAFRHHDDSSGSGRESSPTNAVGGSKGETTKNHDDLAKVAKQRRRLSRPQGRALALLGNKKPDKDKPMQQCPTKESCQFLFASGTKIHRYSLIKKRCTEGCATISERFYLSRGWKCGGCVARPLQRPKAPTKAPVSSSPLPPLPTPLAMSRTFPTSTPSSEPTWIPTLAPSKNPSAGHSTPGRNRELRLTALPKSVVVGVSTLATLTVDAADWRKSGIKIDRFDIYRLEQEATLVAAVHDTGSGIGDDTVAGDWIFSNVLAVLADAAGQAFSYRAVPIIGNVQEASSLKAATAQNAIESYVTGPGRALEPVDMAPLVLTTESMNGLILAVKYSWSSGYGSLNTGTTFLSSTEGYKCGGCNGRNGGGNGSKDHEKLAFREEGDYSKGASDSYMEKIGENIGSEVVMVRLGEALSANKWADETTVSLNADWSGGSYHGPATVSIYVTDATSKPIGRAVSFVINPGKRVGCASTAVAETRVRVNPFTGVNTITMSPAVAVSMD